MTDLVRIRTANSDLTVSREYAEGLGDAVQILEDAPVYDHRGRIRRPEDKGERHAVPKDSGGALPSVEATAKTAAPSTVASSPATTPKRRRGRQTPEEAS